MAERIEDVLSNSSRAIYLRITNPQLRQELEMGYGGVKRWQDNSLKNIFHLRGKEQ